MKTDARVRYTKMRIREAFCACLKEKPLNRITVKELCELAEINRATFYTHYNDPFDLFEQLKAECLQNIERQIAEQRGSGSGVLSGILRGVQNPASMAALLASPNGDPGFASQITELYQQSFAPSLAAKLPGLDEAGQKSVYRFLAGGCSSLISQWIEDGMAIPAEEMAERIGALCSAFIETCGRHRKKGAGKE